MSDRQTHARNGRQAYHHGDLRESLLDAAMAEVELNGPEGVSLSALAKGLGVSQAAPYRHFADRDDLLTAVAARGFDSFSATLLKTMAIPSARSPIGRFAHAYLQHGVERIGLYRLMYGSRLVDKSKVGSPLQVSAERGFLGLLDILGSAEALPEREFIALKLWVALHGVVMLVDQGFLPLKVRRVRAEELVDDIVGETELAIARQRASATTA